MADISYYFTPENGIGETEVIVTYRKKDKEWIAIIPQKDEWLDGDLEDLYDCIGSAIKKMQEMKINAKSDKTVETTEDKSHEINYYGLDADDPVIPPPPPPPDEY